MTRSNVTPFNRGRSPPQFLAEAAHGSLKPPPTSRLRRAYLHLSYSMTISRLLDTTSRRTVHEPLDSYSSHQGSPRRTSFENAERPCLLHRLLPLLVGSLNLAP